MIPRSFNNQLAGQIGESLVVAELGRRGIVATAFAGNVPDIAYSGVIRPVIPKVSGHPFRFYPATDSGASGHPVM